MTFTDAAFGRTTCRTPIVTRLPPLAAMCTRPLRSACTTPVELTVARVTSDDVHVGCDAGVSLLFSSTTSAVNCLVCPRSSVRESGDMMNENAGAATLSRTESTTLRNVRATTYVDLLEHSDRTSPVES